MLSSAGVSHLDANQMFFADKKKSHDTSVIRAISSLWNRSQISKINKEKK